MGKRDEISVQTNPIGQAEKRTDSNPPASENRNGGKDLGETQPTKSAETITPEKDEKFESFYNRIEERYDMESQGIPKEVIKGAYDFYSERFPGGEEDEFAEAIRLDIQFGQIQQYEEYIERARALNKDEAVQETKQELAADPDLERFIDKINAKYDLSSMNVDPEVIEGGYYFCKEYYSDFSEEDWMSAIKTEIEEGQINHFLKFSRAAEARGRDKGKEFEHKLFQNMEGMEILQAMGGNKEAVEKMNNIFKGTEFETVIEGFDKLYETKFDYSEYKSDQVSVDYSVLIREGELNDSAEPMSMSSESAVQKIHTVLSQLTSPIAEIWFSIKGIDIKKLKEMLYAAIDDLSSGGSVGELNILVFAAIKNAG